MVSLRILQRQTGCVKQFVFVLCAFTLANNVAFEEDKETRKHMQHKCLHLSTTAYSLTGIIQKEAGQSTNGNYPLNNDPSFINVLYIYQIFIISS